MEEKMVTIFFVLCLLCGIGLAAFSAKLFMDTKKGASFMGITLGTPQPAIVGMVIGVIVLLSALIVFLPLSSEIGEKDEELKGAKGNLSRIEGKYNDAKDEIDQLTGERDEAKSDLDKAQSKIKDLDKELKAKEEATVEKTGETVELEETIKSLQLQIKSKGDEAQSLREELSMTKGRIKIHEQEVTQLKRDLETEREFRRDFKEMVEMEEASPSGTRNKIYFKLRDLRNKYFKK
jgi:peptidoglycan hydrolase CwlO-like protein